MARGQVGDVVVAAQLLAGAGGRGAGRRATQHAVGAARLVHHARLRPRAHHERARLCGRGRVRRGPAGPAPVGPEAPPRPRHAPAPLAPPGSPASSSHRGPRPPAPGPARTAAAPRIHDAQVRVAAAARGAQLALVAVGGAVRAADLQARGQRGAVGRALAARAAAQHAARPARAAVHAVARVCGAQDARSRTGPAGDPAASARGAALWRTGGIWSPEPATGRPGVDAGPGVVSWGGATRSGVTRPEPPHLSGGEAGPPRGRLARVPRPLRPGALGGENQNPLRAAPFLPGHPGLLAAERSFCHCFPSGETEAGQHCEWRGAGHLSTIPDGPPSSAAWGLEGKLRALQPQCPCVYSGADGTHLTGQRERSVGSCQDGACRRHGLPCQGM